MAVSAGEAYFGLRMETRQFENDARRTKKVVDDVESHAKSGLGAALHDVQQSFGRGSELTHLIHAITLGGPLLGLGLIAREGAHVAHEIGEMAEKFHEGTINGAQLGDTILRKLPFGSLVAEIGEATAAMLGFETSSRKTAKALEDQKHEMELLAVTGKAFREESLQDIAKGLPRQQEELARDLTRKQDEIEQAMLRSFKPEVKHYSMAQRIARGMTGFDSDAEQFDEEAIEHNKQVKEQADAAIEALQHTHLQRMHDLTMTATNKLLDDQAEAHHKEITEYIEFMRKQIDATVEFEGPGHAGPPADQPEKADALIRANRTAGFNRFRDMTISIAEEMARAAAHPQLPGIAKSGSAEAISAVNRFQSGRNDDATAYLKDAATIAKQQLQRLDALLRAASVLVNVDNQGNPI